VLFKNEELLLLLLLPLYALPEPEPPILIMRAVLSMFCWFWKFMLGSFLPAELNL
jgi:hypothetical protein